MANFNKSFNFRGGFQVDDSVFIVRGQQVGIGSSVPTQRLDVNGAIKAKGLELTSELPVGIQSANVGFLSATTIHVGVASISAGVITATSLAGIVTYYGDGRFLEGLPTSQWLDIDVGLGYTSIYAAGNVGVDTDDPRYAFQVGGIPFATIVGPPLPDQDGVGIEDGAIYASGIVSTRGDISAVGTIIAGTEFIGIGSNITILNADNLGVGSIGSMRYGDLIVTKEVIADSFIGTATIASDLASDAQIDIDEVRANRIEAVDKILSLNGFLQIGVDETVANVGDIEVNKIFGDSTIYGISSSGTSRFLVGQDRIGSGIRYGGIQKGISPGNISGPTDLDLVNFDAGNLNFYLGGTTTGNFRWINGQTSSILAELTPESNFRINGSVVNADPTLQVNGTTLLDGLTVVSDDLVVTGVSSLTEVTVSDTLEVDGAAVFNGSIELRGNIGITSLLIGTDPTLGGTGTLITETSAYLAGTMQVGGNVVTSSGNITAPTFIGNLSATVATFSDTLSNSGNSFSVGNSGDMLVNTINATGSIAGTDLSGDSLSVSGTVSANAVDASSFAGGAGNFDSVVSTGNVDGAIGNLSTINSTDIQTTTLSTADLTVTGTASLPSIDITELSVNNLTSSNSSIGIDVDLQMNTNNITANQITCNTLNVSTFDTTVPGASIQFLPNIDNGTITSLSILVTFGGITEEIKLPVGSVTTDPDNGDNDALYLGINL